MAVDVCLWSNSTDGGGGVCLCVCVLVCVFGVCGVSVKSGSGQSLGVCKRVEDFLFC